MFFSNWCIFNCQAVTGYGTRIRLALKTVEVPVWSQQIEFQLAPDSAHRWHRSLRHFCPGGGSNRAVLTCRNIFLVVEAMGVLDSLKKDTKKMLVLANHWWDILRCFSKLTFLLKPGESPSWRQMLRCISCIGNQPSALGHDNDIVDTLQVCLNLETNAEHLQCSIEFPLTAQLLVVHRRLIPKTQISEDVVPGPKTDRALIQTLLSSVFHGNVMVAQTQASFMQAQNLRSVRYRVPWCPLG